MDNKITAYFWSYAHKEFSEEQLEKWDLVVGEPVYVVPDLKIFTRRPDLVDEVTHVKTSATDESNAAGRVLLGLGEADA